LKIKIDKQTKNKNNNNNWRMLFEIFDATSRDLRVYQNWYHQQSWRDRMGDKRNDVFEKSDTQWVVQWSSDDKKRQMSV
jgi:hypothetical protein